MDLSLPSSVADAERACLTAIRPSRIREVQADGNGGTSVDLIDVDSAQAVALRGMLELFGVHVRRFAIGQARQLVRALGGEAARRTSSSATATTGAWCCPRSPTSSSASSRCTARSAPKSCAPSPALRRTRS
jgi:hypothetical protein